MRIETGIVRFLPVLLLTPTGERHQHRVLAPRLLTDAPGRVVAVQPWHPDVDEDQVGAERRRHVQRLQPIVSRPKLVAHEREHLRWRLAALILAQAGIITVVVGLILRAVHGDMPASELVVTLAGIGLFSVGLADFSSLFGQQSAEGGHVLEFWSLDQITAWVQFPLVGRSPDISRGLEVSARNLCFGYGAEGAMNPVLKEVSFTIRAGSKTVLMAENGAGKSTLLSVIQRAFDITSGELKLGGVEIAEIAKETLRSLIGVLPQEFELFAVSAEEYIAMGCVGEPDQNRVRWAARMSGADRAKKCSA